MIIFCAAAILAILFTCTPRLPTRINVGDYDTALALTAVFPTLGLYYYQSRYRNIKRGIEGEKRVTKSLESRLSDNYYLINDVLYVNERGYKENIDHVVLGHNGIFVIETKDYRGKITAKGSYWSVPFPYGRSPSSQAKGNAVWVKKTIDACEVSGVSNIWVEPIVVFSNPDVELQTIDPEVEVVTLDKLVEFIMSYSCYNFSTEQLKALGNGIAKQTQNM
jgi:hypothetical protein